MAIVNFVSCRKSQTVGGLNGVINYCCRKSKTEYAGRQLISGVNCVPQFALQEFMNTKRLHKNTDGRMYYHMIQSFHPSEQLTPEVAHEIALKKFQALKLWLPLIQTEHISIPTSSSTLSVAKPVRSITAIWNH